MNHNKSSTLTEKELKVKLEKEAETKYELQKQLIFVVTKGKELEDKFKELKSSTSE